MKSMLFAAFAVFVLAFPTLAQEIPIPTPKPDTGAHVVRFVNYQNVDQLLASKFKGTDVVGSDNKKIGIISDILFNGDGTVEAYVIEVGGFLGIGSKDVGISPDSFVTIPGDISKNEPDKLRLDMVKDYLKAAAHFEPYRPLAASARESLERLSPKSIPVTQKESEGEDDFLWNTLLSAAIMALAGLVMGLVFTRRLSGTLITGGICAVIGLIGGFVAQL